MKNEIRRTTFGLEILRAEGIISVFILYCTSVPAEGILIRHNAKP